MESVKCATCGETPSFQAPSLSPAAMAQVLEYLRTNTSPSDESSYLVILNERSPQIPQYDNEIHRLEERLEKLRAERDQLAAYVDACRSLFSPVRRLPNELLEDIFDMCTPASARRLSDNDTTSQELARLSKAHLLKLAQVCLRWHNVSLETPRLWSEIVVDTQLWKSIRISQLRECVKMLEKALKRSGTCPLTIEFSNKDQLFPSAATAQKLLMEQAERWKSAYIEAPLQTLRNMDNLPLLKSIYLVGKGGTVALGAAPRLKCFKVYGNVSSVPQLPWSQLELVTIRATPSTPAHVSSIVSLINNMPPASDLELELLELTVQLPLNLPSAVSDLSALSLLMSGKTQDDDTAGTLAAILESLTLRKLEFLEFLRDRQGLATPLWPSAAFSSFAHRSSLGSCLVELQVHIRITDEQLLECLSLLPSLEALIISDCAGGEESENVLITYTLLRGLTLEADSESNSARLMIGVVPVPALHFFRVSSLFRFTEELYWELLESRLESGRNEDIPFQARLYFLGPPEQALSPDIKSRIDASVRQDRMGFMTGRDPDVAQR